MQADRPSGGSSAQLPSSDVLTIMGIDLSTKPERTGVARLVVSADGISVEVLDHPRNEQHLVEMAVGADRVAIDAPFGWPSQFVDALAHHAAGAWPHASSGKDQRAAMSRRVTDIRTRKLSGVWPLSVSADRLSSTAMCCALLQTMWHRGEQVDRGGHPGRFMEVYPAGALACWGLGHTVYKGKGIRNAIERKKIVHEFKRQTKWLDLGGCEQRCLDNDDYFDAVIAAVVGLAFECGATHEVTDHAAAAIEGWIHLPNLDLPAIGALATKRQKGTAATRTPGNRQ